MAGLPAPHLFGAQRVVIACDFDASLTQAERRTMCEQLAAKAQRLTSLPVTAGRSSDVDPTNIARLSEQLTLRVDVSGTSVDDRRKALGGDATAADAMRQGLQQLRERLDAALEG